MGYLLKVEMPGERPLAAANVNFTTAWNMIQGSLSPDIRRHVDPVVSDMREVFETGDTASLTLGVVRARTILTLTQDL